MKHIRHLLTAAAGIALTLALSACQLSEILPKRETEAPLPGGTGTTPAVTTAAFDPATADLTKYVTLGNYKGIAVEDKAAPLTDEAFDAQLTAYLNSLNVRAKITDRKTAENDTVVMDYVGTLDGVAFAGGTAQGQSITLNDLSGYIDGFAQGLIGVTPGETVKLDLTFPTDYHATDLAGKAVVFTVTVHYILGDVIPAERTDAYITEATEGEFTSFAEFSAFYRGYLDDSAADDAHRTALSALFETVFENTVFHSVPAELTEFYYVQNKAQYESYAAAYGVPYETVLQSFGLTEASLRAEAEKLAKQDLVFFSLVQAEGLTVTDAEYTEELAILAAGAGASAAELEAYYGKDYISDVILWNKMMDMLYSYANVSK